MTIEKSDLVIKETKKKLKFIGSMKKIISDYESGYISFDDFVKWMFIESVTLIENKNEL